MPATHAAISTALIVLASGVLSTALSACANRPPVAGSVIEGPWQVTVYYTAVESYHHDERIKVTGCPELQCEHGTEDLGRYPRDFAAAVRDEGTGRITSGPHADRYLNWSHNVGYWLDDAPRDAHGRPLEPFRSAAADGLPHGTSPARASVGGRARRAGQAMRVVGEVDQPGDDGLAVPEQQFNAAQPRRVRRIGRPRHPRERSGRLRRGRTGARLQRPLGGVSAEGVLAFYDAGRAVRQTVSGTVVRAGLTGRLGSHHPSECLHEAHIDVPVHERQGDNPSPTLVINGTDVVAGPTYTQIHTGLEDTLQT